MSKTSSAVQRFALSALTLGIYVAAHSNVMAAGPVPGAVFTSKSVNGPCDTVDSNIYASKLDVYVNGGPKGANGPGLPASTKWYVQVTDPSGFTVLGTSTFNPTPPTTTPVDTDALGKFAKCYRLYDIVSSAPGLLGYLDTPNNGGEYKVWVSEVPNFANDQTKTDNFKVRNDFVPPQETSRITIRKYYDANANGVYDSGDQELFDWKVDLLTPNIAKLTAPAIYDGLPDGVYTTREYAPIEKIWTATGVQVNGLTVPNGASSSVILNSAVVTLARPDVTDVTVAYGNVCTGAGGGFTLGFWSNKNGEAAMAPMAASLSLLASYNLKTATNADFDPTKYADFRNWLLNGNAVNMKYMLSVQLATMVLNVKVKSDIANTLIYAPGTNSALSTGFARLGDVMTEANNVLGDIGVVVPVGMTLRNYQEYLKNALDNANNNKTFVQSTPCAHTFAAN
jgi:hypothetical protein